MQIYGKSPKRRFFGNKFIIVIFVRLLKILNQDFVRRILTKIANLIGLLSGLTLIASCQQDQPRSPETNQLTVGFYAGGVATRTVIGENGLSAAWEEGDKMAVWAKNSSDTYTLSRTVFGMYGVGGSTGVFTATLDAPMAEDRYMYMAAYPVPKNVQGTIASFDLSDEQDGRASGGSDIMIADPVMHGPLTEIPKPDDHSTLRLSMNHILHHLRFYVPEGTDMEGESVRDIFVTMPPRIYLVIGAQQYLEELLGCKVDIVRDHPSLNPYLRQQIEQDGICIFSAA